MFSTEHVEEPVLVFGGGGEEKDPKKGLKRNGPFTYSGEEPSLHNIRIGIIGNREGIRLTNEILDLLKKEMATRHDENEWLFPSYPGMNKDSKFNCTIAAPDIMEAQISDLDVNRIVDKRFDDTRARIAFGVDLFAKKVQELVMDDDKPDVIICTLPKMVETYCGISDETRGAKSVTRMDRIIRDLRADGQKFLTDDEFMPDYEEEETSFDFWNSLKGRVLKSRVPIQILHESTCNDILDFGTQKRHKSQDPCSFAWNLSTALLYKSNGKPWRLAKLSQDTCYVGISFFRDRLNQKMDMQTSMAQMFLHTGEGLVLRGTDVDSDEHTKIPYLRRDQALALLSRAIDLYKEKAGRVPGRVVIHKTTEFTQDEREGFNTAIHGKGVFRRDLVTVSYDRVGIRFMRAGMFPPLRGTMIHLGKDNFLLYSSGFTTQVRTYPGHSIPKPLNIRHEGDSDSKSIAREILELTKLNWNTTAFSTAMPITIKFASKVGKVLSELPDKEIPETSYRFFM
ncbi:MAG: hypothetical protein MPJ78_18945 [Hyphomicrobiaceae bacterium]|nr:hypothetical protein [Hyphomicrobiaceae bacterium]